MGAIEYALNHITLHTDRTEKPRQSGVTMVIDWGLGLMQQQDLSRLCGQYIDLAKVATGISRLLSPEILQQKILGYREEAIEAFPGGMLLEYAYAQQKAEYYLDTCKSLGYRIVEVSDNAVALKRPAKLGLVKSARQRGLKVLGEVGSKHEHTPIDDLIADTQALLDAGCWKVFVEAAEMFQEGNFLEDIAERFVATVDINALIFELPGRWIPNIHQHQLIGLGLWLLEKFGADVNIGNISPEDVLLLETLRTKTGVNTLCEPTN